ncbi:MAG: cellulose-binding protein, partial [Bacteroidetes bacterium]|nr:cellulose-binding protein [Bacteroidota bacterium]
MPIGNSITQADNNHQSYRYQLWKKLIDEGIDFDLVGSMTDHYNCGTPVFPDYLGHSFDQNHEGHWGWRCDQVLNGTGSSANCRGSGSLSNWLQNYTPDMALIHLGSNDMFQGQSVETTIQELKDVVTTLRADNPDIVIILAQLIPTTLPSNVWITALNLQIPTIAVDMEDPLSPIYIVDQNTGFDATTDTYDGVHPNVAP